MGNWQNRSEFSKVNSFQNIPGNHKHHEHLKAEISKKLNTITGIDSGTLRQIIARRVFITDEIYESKFLDSYCLISSIEYISISTSSNVLVALARFVSVHDSKKPCDHDEESIGATVSRIVSSEKRETLSDILNQLQGIFKYESKMTEEDMTAKLAAILNSS